MAPPQQRPEVFRQPACATPAARRADPARPDAAVAAVGGGPADARSRLDYVARKTGEAADKVLNSVELAKREQATILTAVQRIADGDADGAPAWPRWPPAARRTDEQLTTSCWRRTSTT